MGVLLNTRDDELVYLARKLRFVREVPENRGQRVEGIQRWSGGQAGDSWCCEFATMLLDVVYEGSAPFERTASCDVVLEKARSMSWLTQRPCVGDLYLVLRSETDAHHVGIVTAVGASSFTGLSGNTNNDGSDNGNGVYEKEIAYSDRIVFVRYARGAA